MGADNLALTFQTDLAGTDRLEFPFTPSKPLLQLQRDPGFVAFAQRTFPDDRDSPACLQQTGTVPSIPFRVGVELALPEFRAGRRGGRVRTTGMAVPEAAVHEADGSELTKDEIGSTRKSAVMQTISQTVGVKSPPQDEFGPRVSSADSRHHAGAGRLIHYVRHCRSLRVLEAGMVKRICRELSNMTRSPMNIGRQFGQDRSVNPVLRLAGRSEVDGFCCLPQRSPTGVAYRRRGKKT